MTAWLDPVRDALDRRAAPLPVLVRDDDGGWDDDGLARVVGAVGEAGLRIDLAVIPNAVGPALARRLREWRADGVGVHQHGLAHDNHEDEGRKCEFGPSRDRATQRADIRAGRALLAEALGDAPDPVFTPPWNRCTADTAACLVELGISVLSREHRAEPLDVPGLAEVPVNVDWPRDGRRPERATLATDIARIVTGEAFLGLMLHHAAMGDDDHVALAQLMGLLVGAGAHATTICETATAAASR